MKTDFPLENVKMFVYFFLQVWLEKASRIILLGNIWVISPVCYPLLHILFE
jgi:hypothetical protein